MADDGEKKFRIHISGLSQDITNAADLTSKFTSFGSVNDSIIVKDTSSGLSKGYGFVSLVCAEKDWLRCLSALNGTKWKGSQLKLELARPSSLERINQERSQSQIIEKPPRKYFGNYLADDQSLMTDDKVETRKGWKKVRYGRAVASLKLRTPEGRLIHYEPSLHQHQLKNFSKKEELIHKEIDSIPISSLTWFPEFSIASNSKRAQSNTTSFTPQNGSAIIEESLIENKVSVLEQKAEQNKKSRALISAALSNLDKKENNPNHDFFSSDEDSQQNSLITTNSLFQDDIAKTKTRSLFDDSSSDDSDNDAFNQKFLFGEDAGSEGEASETEIGIKKVFEGEKGQQRLNLQRRYGNDPRFKLGELFLDSDEEDDEIEAPADNDKDAQIALELAAEKDNALNLLQDVLGLPVESPQTIALQNKKQSGVEWKEMMRYDPDAPDADELIIDKNALIPVSQVKRSEIKLDSISKDPEPVQAPIPEVSADRHFTVSNTIGSIFTKDTEKRDKGIFSLFGNEEEEEEKSESDSEILAPAPTTKITGVTQIEKKPVDPTEPLFFFHFGNNDLYPSSRFSGYPVFCRTRNLEDLEAELNQKRSRLIRNYKSLHRSAKAKDDQPKKMFKRRKIMF